MTEERVQSTEQSEEATEQPAGINEHSFMAMIGHGIEPLLAPLGQNWRSSIALITSIPAKELVVSTLGVMYAGDQPVDEPVDETLDETLDESQGDTRLQKALVKSVTPAGALAYMVFILLYFPCIATFVAIKNEGGWKWAIITAVYTIFLAWVAAFVTFRLASLFI